MPLKLVPRRDRKLNRLVKKAESRLLRTGQVLFSYGDPAHDLFLVRKGCLRLVTDPGTPHERTAALAGPAEITGEEALTPHVRRRTTARASEETEVLVLPGNGVNRVLRTADRTFEAFLQALEADLALARYLANPPGGNRAQSRLGALLLHLSARLGHPGGGGTWIPVRLTHQVLADLAGLHRSTVTTILNGWIYEGILEHESGRFRVVQHAVLSPEPAVPHPWSPGPQAGPPGSRSGSPGLQSRFSGPQSSASGPETA